jgi:hypothetical protein
MGHLKHEDMAGMIGGNINKRTRKKFLKHLSRCQSCSKVFTETLKFFQEEEGEQEQVFTLPVLQKKSPGFLHRVGDFFANKRLRPAFAAAALILVLLTLPFILTRDGHISDQVQSIKERFFSPKSKYGFGGSPDEISSALRAGIFIEDLSVVVNHAKDKELKTKIGKRLIIQLRNISPEETDKLFPNPEDVGELKKAVKNIERLIESKSLTEPFLFGRFLERSFLDTFKDKRPLPKDIERYRQLARKPGFSPEVLKEFDKLKIATVSNDIRETCEKIEKIFFSY